MTAPGGNQQSGGQASHLSVREVEQIAQRSAHLAARETVRQTFRMLGADIEDQKSLNELRSDLVHARKIRHATSAALSKASLVFVGLVAMGMAVALWEGAKTFLVR